MCMKGELISDGESSKGEKSDYFLVVKVMKCPEMSKLRRSS